MSVRCECLTGDVVHSRHCDCGAQLGRALAPSQVEGRAALLSRAQEGRGIGLLNKLKTHELQENGLDTVEANLELVFEAVVRECGIGSQILADLGLARTRVLDRAYLEARQDELGHGPYREWTVE